MLNISWLKSLTKPNSFRDNTLMSLQFSGHIPTCCHSLFFPPAASGMPSCGSQAGVLWLCYTRPDWGLTAPTPTEKTEFPASKTAPQVGRASFPSKWKVEAGKCHPRNFTSESFSLWLLLCFRQLPKIQMRLFISLMFLFLRRKTPVSQPYFNWESVRTFYIIGKEFSSCWKWYEPCPLTKNDKKKPGSVLSLRHCC